MSIPGNLLFFGIILVAGIAILNVLSPNGNIVFEISNYASELFSVTNNAFADMGNPIKFLDMQK